MITCHVESLTEMLPELRPLLPLHYEELALNKDKVPLDPQYDVYLERDANGGVLLVTLREMGELIGYFIGFIAPGLHYRTCLTCTMDIFYVRQDKRGGRAGIKLFRFVMMKIQIPIISTNGSSDNKSSPQALLSVTYFTSVFRLFSSIVFVICS